MEEARFVGIYALIFLSAAGTAGYGVSLMQRAVSAPSFESRGKTPRIFQSNLRGQHIAVPLVMQFISGAATSSIFTVRTPPPTVHCIGERLGFLTSNADLWNSPDGFESKCLCYCPSFL